MEKLSIHQWDEADRPREKLEAHGAAALTNAELLAILIGSGSPKEDAVSLMRRIMADNDGRLAKLGKRTLQELCAYNGIGKAKAITLLAACELGRRREAEPTEERQYLTSSSAIYDCFRRLEDLPHEEFHVALLSNRLQLLATRLVGRGGLTQTVADVRLILREAILLGAVNIAVCHNHPSGSLKPSKQDCELTYRLKQAADLMEIRLIDHLIIAEGGYYSFHDENNLL